MGEVVPVTKHPAAYSSGILAFMDRRIREEQRALGRPMTVADPMAGIGRVHRLAKPDKIETWGIEIEEEWSACHERTITGDCLDPSTWGPLEHAQIDAWVLSPPYANRMSDNHDAKDGSTRRSYRHDLGRPLHPNNSGGFPWGARYRRFIADAYGVLFGRLRPGGLFVLNTSAFIRQGELVDAPLFHLGAALAAGFVEVKPAVRIDTQRLTHGTNRQRVPGEIIHQLRRPE